ncbi:MAG: hypothetical protein RLZZ502_571 [Pseudomonadota bacterium]|jgi:hypothetical protein
MEATFDSQVHESNSAVEQNEADNYYSASLDNQESELLRLVSAARSVY